MLCTRDLVVMSPSHRGISGLVRCGRGAKSMLGNKL